MKVRAPKTYLLADDAREQVHVVCSPFLTAWQVREVVAAKDGWFNLDLGEGCTIEFRRDMLFAMITTPKDPAVSGETTGDKPDAEAERGRLAGAEDCREDEQG